MSFEWKFRGGPTRTDVMTPEYMLGEEQRRAMQGYRPSPSGSMEGYNPMVGPENWVGGVAGYYPGSGQAQGGEGGNYRSGEAMGSGDRTQALLDEYNRNKTRIAEIKTRIAELEASDRKALNAKYDELDMNLAANRAAIGDLGNSQVHQGRILTRSQLSNLSNGSADSNNYSKMKEKVDDALAIDDLYSAMNAADVKPEQVPYYERAIAMRENLFKTKWGEPYGGPLAPNTSKVGVNENIGSQAEWEELFNGVINRKGGYSDDDIEMLSEQAYLLPRGSVRNGLLEKIAEAKKNTNEAKAARTAKAKANANKAIDNAIKDHAIDTGNMTRGDTKTYTDPATNITVTATYVTPKKRKFSAGGVVRYVEEK